MIATRNYGYRLNLTVQLCEGYNLWQLIASYTFENQFNISTEVNQVACGLKVGLWSWIFSLTHSI